MIQTLVFLDMETTGITSHEMHKTKITELCLIAVKTAHLLETRSGLIPRVEHKISMCFNPCKLIIPDCSKETGLTNELLENESTFNKKVFTIFESFISMLEKPVCLIAHNGLRFDFPILKSVFNSLNVELCEDLLCSDSLHFFYDIMEGQKRETPTYKVIPSGTIEIIDLVDSDDDNIQKYTETTPKKLTLSENKLNYKRTSVPLEDRLNWFDDKPKESYRLKNIYRRLLKRSPREAHRAENDCLMLLECAVVLSKDFMTWVDENNFLFSLVKPMTAGRH